MHGVPPLKVLILCFGLISAGSSADIPGKTSLGDQVRNRLVKFESFNAALLKEVHDDSPSGAWPVQSKSTCKTLKTRDIGSEVDIEKAAKQDPALNEPNCGFNLFTWAKRQTELKNPRSRRSSTPIDSDTKIPDIDEVDDIARFLRELEKNFANDNVQFERRRSNSLKSNINSEDEEGHTPNVIGLNKLVKNHGDISARIVGGHESREARFPWLGALGEKTKGMRCGATLINHRWIVTAAHCFKENEAPCAYNVRFGAFDWLNDTTGHHEDYELESIVVHKDFDHKALVNDFALAKLSRDVKLSPDGYVNSICLPSPGKSPLRDDACVAAGWGTTAEGAEWIPDNVQEVTLPLLPNDQCKFPLTERQLCAGSLEGGIDTCQGDSGGPLMRYSEGKWYIAGVTSYGNGCGRKGYPGIYTDVSDYVDYITSVINRYS